MYMNIFLMLYTYYIFSKNSIKVADCNNESINHLFENDEIEFNRNVNMGISCHVYNFNKVEFYEIDARSDFIDYLDTSESMVTEKTRPTMTFISIISYFIPNIDIIKSEVYKILQFIISPEDSNEYPNNIKNLYKIEITKMNPTNEKKDLFNNLPNFNQTDIHSLENLKHSVFHIFLLEDIKNNNALKCILRNEIVKFFYYNTGKGMNTPIMKILIIEAINNPKQNLFIDMNNRFKSNLKLMVPTITAFFKAFDLLENNNSYSQNNIELCHKKKKLEKNSFITRFNLHSNKSSLVFYKKPDINNLDYYIKYTDKNFEFEILKHLDTNDTYTKLLYFLGYSPLERSYRINISNKIYKQQYFYFEIKVFIYKNIIKQANNQVPEISKKVKQIIVSRISNDNSYGILIDYSYEMDAHSSEGFPLSNVERETIQEKEYNKNIEAKRLINFIDFYECFMLNRKYFYFNSFFSINIDFNYGFCFYRKEIWYKYLNIKEIYKTIENSLKFKTDSDLRKNHKTFSALKSIEVFKFKREYTKNKKGVIYKHENNEVLKGFVNHHFFGIELCFYSDIQRVKYYSSAEICDNINYFIKVDFGFNKNYFIFFKEVVNNWSNNDELYNIIDINNEANKFIMPILKELLYLNDDEEAQKHALNFIGVIFNMTKMYLNDNLEIKKNLCYNLRDHLNSFSPRTHKLIYMFLDISKNNIAQISQRKVYLIKELFQTSIVIIKRNFKNMFYEACVIRSISNITDNSQEILESLL